MVSVLRQTCLVMMTAFLVTCSSVEGTGPSGPSENPGMLNNATSFNADRYLEIILDASGSMGAEVEGERKIDTAKNMLKVIGQSLQEENIAINLTAFGHRKSWSCTDIEEIFTNQFKTPEQLSERVSGIEPAERGKTPLARTLVLAYERLKKIRAPKGIFVITDGMETCGGDPCKVAKILEKELDVKIYVLTYNPSSMEEFESLSCLGDNELVEDPAEFLKKAAALKAQFDKDYEEKLGELETVQTLRVLGPKQDEWATATLLDGPEGDQKQFRFLAALGTTLPKGNYQVEVHYNPPVFFKDVEIKESEKKVLTVKGEGAMMLELDFPGVELEAVNLVDSQKYKVMAGKQSRLPIGKYNVFGVTASGLAFQWLDQYVTPGAVVELTLPNWSLFQVTTKEDLSFDLFPVEEEGPKKRVPRKNFANREDLSSVKQFKDSLGFFATNAPHIVEPGLYKVVLSDGRVIENISLEKGEKLTRVMRDP